MGARRTCGRRPVTPRTSGGDRLAVGGAVHALGGLVRRQNDVHPWMQLRPVPQAMLNGTEDLALLDAGAAPAHVQIRPADDRRRDPCDRVGRRLDRRVRDVLDGHAEPGPLKTTRAQLASRSPLLSPEKRSASAEHPLPASETGVSGTADGEHPVRVDHGVKLLPKVLDPQPGGPVLFGRWLPRFPRRSPSSSLL